MAVYSRRRLTEIEAQIVVEEREPLLLALAAEWERITGLLGGTPSDRA